MLRFASVLRGGQRSPAQLCVHGFTVGRICGHLVDNPFGGFESNVLLRPGQRVGVDVARGHVDVQISGVGRIWNAVFAAHGADLNAGIVVAILRRENGGANKHMWSMLRKVLFQKVKRISLGGVCRVVGEFVGCGAVASVAVHLKQRAGMRIQRDAAEQIAVFKAHENLLGGFLRCAQQPLTVLGVAELRPVGQLRRNLFALRSISKPFQRIVLYDAPAPPMCRATASSFSSGRASFSFSVPAISA